jgi:hypothetical protein
LTRNDFSYLFKKKTKQKQIWDVAESPMFAAAMLEVTDACYRIVFEQLRRNVYTLESATSSEGRQQQSNDQNSFPYRTSTNNNNNNNNNNSINNINNYNNLD